MKSTAVSRDPYWDNVKSILIFLVVLGHFLIILREHTDSKLMQVLFTYIYLFHMPAFVMVSGYFSKRYADRPADPNRFVGLFLAFLAYEAALWLAESIAFGKMMPVDPLSETAAPWYLMCLAWWYLLLPVITRLGRERALAASIILALVAGLDPASGSFLCMDRTINLMPFFLFGFYYEPVVRPSVRSAAAGLAVMALMFVLLYVFFGPVRPYKTIMYGDKTYADLGIGILPGITTKIAWMLIAVVLSIALLRIVPARSSFITRAGRNSLGIYVFHRLLRPFIMPVLWGHGSPLDGNGFVLIGSAVIVSVLVTALFSIDVFSNLVNMIVRGRYISAGPAESRQWHSARN